MSEWIWISGVNAVEAVLATNSREVKAIYVAHGRLDSRIAQMNRLARDHGVPIERQGKEFFEELVETKGHGGVVAQVGPRVMQTLSDLTEFAKPVIVMLDGVEDPFNFGQAVRSLYAAGIDGLLVGPRNWLSVSAVIRASAGATEWMPVAEVDSPEIAVGLLRPRGFRIAVATPRQAQPMNEVDLTGPLLLVIGGEKRGVTHSFMKTADLRVSIPYGRAFDQSLGTAAATSVLAFEIFRQRRTRGP